MGSKSIASLALFIAVLNLLLFSLVNACDSCPAPSPQHNPSPNPKPSSNSIATCPAPSPQHNPSPNPKPSSNSIATCPRDALKLGVCANVLRSLLNVELGHPPVKPCCSLLFGLADLEAAVCLCTAIKANVLGINILNIPVALRLLLNVCGDKGVAALFKAPCSQPSHRGECTVVSLVVIGGGSNLLCSYGFCAGWAVGVGVATMDCWCWRPPDLLFRSARLLLLLFMYGPLVLACSCWALDEAIGLDWESDRVWDFPMVWILIEDVLSPSSIT